MNARPLRIGVVCHPTAGGSGVVATEIALAMARRGHQVHVVCTDRPRRLPVDGHTVRFHRVQAREYPVFPAVPYSLALASKLVEVANAHGLDVIHAHYAVPHATSAWMAREVLGAGGPRIVTTLHGTDITLVGADDSYLPITRHSILRSDAVTAPSEYLRRETHVRFDIDPARVPIEVLPNFVDPDVFRPHGGGRRVELEALFGPQVREVPVLAHASNFRPVKRLDLVVAAFAQVVARRRALLLLIGDGPDRAEAQAQLDRLGLSDRACLVGERTDLAPLIRECAAFVLPSDSESFGLAALEALASGVPVVASDVGGLPEVVRDGVTGHLVPAGDAAALADRLVALLDDEAGRARLGSAARLDAVERFRLGPLIDRYEALYHRLVAERVTEGDPEGTWASGRG